MLKVFNSPGSTHKEVQKAGEGFLLKLYGAIRKCHSLDQLRFILYKKAVSKTTLSSSFKLAKLPPTSAAAKQNSYRTYLTVQGWMGNSLQPAVWGWKLDSSKLIPVDIEQQIAPEILLNMVSCGCKEDGCGTTCGCRKIGLHCSNLCAKCNGQTCTNAAVLIDEDEDIEYVTPDSQDSDEEIDSNDNNL